MWNQFPTIYALLYSSFSEMNLANLPNLAIRFTFYTYLSSKCSEYTFKTFQNEIKFKI